MSSGQIKKQQVISSAGGTLMKPNTCFGDKVFV